MKTTMRIIAPAIFAATFWGGLADAQDKVLRFATWDSDESLAIEEAIARSSKKATPA
jgi:spermidine/putrescine-binding protein